MVRFYAGRMGLLRAAGQNTAALDASIAAMLLEDSDGALVEQARSLAAKLDTETDAHLLVRYESHYARALAALAKRSDAGRARAAADTAAARELELARLAAHPGPLERLREQHAADTEGLKRLNARQAAQAKRLLEAELSTEEAAAEMRMQPVMVDMLLARAERERDGGAAGWA